LLNRYNTVWLKKDVAFDNPLYLDRERFIARSLSGSYSLKEGDKEYTEYMKAIEAAFEKYANKGIVSIANRSVAYIGNVKSRYRIL